MKVFFKFRPEVSASDRDKVLHAVDDRTGGKVTQLFPETEVKELSAHHVVACPTAAQASALAAHLSSLPEIEYAETEVKRSIH